MSSSYFTFRKEPKGQAYYDLIDYALKTQKCRFAFLIVSFRQSLNESGRQVLETFHPSLIETSDVSEWPGTKLLGKSTVERYKYRFDFDFADRLKSISHRLYEWEHPALPKDLALMIDDRLPWLFTIAHEKDAVLCLESNELEDLQRLPSIAPLLVEDKVYPEDLAS